MNYPGYVDTNLVFAIYASAIAVSVFIVIFFLLKGRKSILFYSYICFQFLIILWNTDVLFSALPYRHILGRFFIINSLKYFFSEMRIDFFVISFISFSWLIFCLLFTNSLILKKRINFLFLSVPPVFFYICALTDKYHHLFFYYSPGILFWFHTASATIYAVSGILSLIIYSVGQSGYLRKQSILLAVSIVFPLAFRLLEDYKNFILHRGGFFYNFNAMPATFSVTALFIAIITFRYRFLNIVPITLKKLVDNLGQWILVVDSQNKILYVNDSLRKRFAVIDRSLSKDLNVGEFSKHLAALMQDITEGGKVSDAISNPQVQYLDGELCLLFSDKRYFYVNIRPVLIRNMEIIGRIITFNDITEYRGLLEELNLKNEALEASNEELQAANQQLKENAGIVEELAVAKERNRFVRDVHDTLGHTMTVLITLLKVSMISCEKNPAAAKEKLTEALGIAREGMNELRRSILGLAYDKAEDGNMAKTVGELIESFEKSGLNIDYSAEGIDSIKDKRYSNAVFRICQEALTNSLRHGRAENVSIVLRLAGEKLRLYIADDGSGCKEIKCGFGLKGMEQRTAELNGKIQYGSDGESGFSIYVEFPVISEH